MNHLPAVALIDLDLGRGPSGVDVAIALRERDPSIALVLLTSYEDPRLIDTALPTLPRGIRYLRKRDVNNVNEVVSAIHDAANSPLAIQRLEALALTEPQLEILRGVAEGLSTAEIARRRGVTDKAVEGIITRLCEHFDLPRAASHNQRVRLTTIYYQLTGQPPTGTGTTTCVGADDALAIGAADTTAPDVTALSMPATKTPTPITLAVLTRHPNRNIGQRCMDAAFGSSHHGCLRNDTSIAG